MAHANADSDALGHNIDYIEVDRWDLGFAVGYGEISNLIKDFDDTPIYVIPTIAYYGDNWFFDNGSLGYTLLEGNDYSVNLLGTFSSDRAFFYRWDPSNIFQARSSAGGSRNSQNPLSIRSISSEPKLDINELESRHFTYLGGVETFFYSPFGTLKLAVTHDLFNVHNGTEAQFKWSHSATFNRWNIELSAMLDWKSKQIVDYYYGIRASENAYWSNMYQAQSALNQSVAITGQYALTDSWGLLLMARYTHVASTITQSPLVEKNHTTTYFVGAAYRF